MATEKLRVAVIFGGRSGEHEVSLKSAASVIEAMDKSRYEVIPIGISKQGQWLLSNDSKKLLPRDVMSGPTEPVAVLADPTRNEMMQLSGDSRVQRLKPIDVVFPVLHGPYGEDGTVQGLLDLANLPYVGCGVLASACGMDKEIMKRLFHDAGLPIARFMTLLRSRWEKEPAKALREIARKFGFPVFIKPANLGSSVGISKAQNRGELIRAIDLAAHYDRKILVEEAITGREIEVSVLGNEEPIASLPGEIVPGDEFYSYEDKYIRDEAKLIIPTRVSRRTVRALQELAIKAFRAIDGSGLARVDFFIKQRSNRIIVNEINSMPGFTQISMYPKLWEASGISYSNLIDRLIQLAIERHHDRGRSHTSYESPKVD